ncbi:MAG TPA: DUF58 domain-containing protein [Alphaproteobacteria bacterium]|nr:DUF58 domain-containing protein [Alphaproteobacteria bacterium]
MAIKKLNADLVPRIRKLEMFARQTSLSQYIEGNWTTTTKGQGIEFSGYRAYTYGDDASMIDWKATLRSKSLLVKEYNTEKSVNVYFLMDVSNSMLFTSTKKLKAEHAAELVSGLSYAILRSGDGVGVSMFNDKLVTRLPINIGSKMHRLITNDLGNVNNYGGNFSFENTARIIMNVINTRAVLVIVSDFIGLSPEWNKSLRMLSTKFEIIGIMIRDPRDRELPKDTGQFYLEDPFTNEKLYVDTEQYADAYKKYVEKEEAEIAKYFKTSNADFIKITTDKDYYTELTKFFKRRAYTHARG